MEQRERTKSNCLCVVWGPLPFIRQRRAVNSQVIQFASSVTEAFNPLREKGDMLEGNFLKTANSLHLLLLHAGNPYCRTNVWESVKGFAIMYCTASHCLVQGTFTSLLRPCHGLVSRSSTLQLILLYSVITCSCALARFTFASHRNTVRLWPCLWMRPGLPPYHCHLIMYCPLKQCK